MITFKSNNMNKRQHTLFLFLSLGILVFAACKKEGPAGPAGPAGATGAQGPTGPTGPQGSAGTANVIYSRWTSGSTWTPDVTAGLVYYNIPSTSLTQSILSGG